MSVFGNVDVCSSDTHVHVHRTMLRLNDSVTCRTRYYNQSRGVSLSSVPEE